LVYGVAARPASASLKAGERAATLKGVIRDAGCPLFIVQVQTA
jgi:hypothetical protein